MLSNLNLKIEKMGPIDKVNIDIGKVNVIGGLNATGKSTVSKILYCILKGNVANRQEFAYSLIDPSLRRIVRRYRNQIVHEDNELLNTDELIEYDNMYRNLRYFSEEELLLIYEKIKEDINNNFVSNNSWKEENLLNLTRKLDKQLEVIEKNDNELYFSILKRLLASEFYSLKLSGFLNFNGSYNELQFDYSIELRNSLIRNSSSSGFFTLSDVNYIDSVSILDFRNLHVRDFRRNDRTNHLLSNLTDSSESLEFLDEEFNEKIIRVEDKITDMIKGKFEFTREGFSFVSEEGHETLMGDTSSGIKQIGLLQILLANRKIKEGSFLIIDEPEVNLHPEWQIKFAEILCILARDLNVHVYINTHSPMFIEAMSVYSEYYNIEDESNFYLTEKQGNGFTFNRIDNDDMGAVYENLSRPFDDLDDIKAEILYRN